MSSRSVTIVVHEDGELNSRTYRYPRWVVKTALAAGMVIAGLLLLGLALYLPIVAQASRVPGLVRQVDRLEAENRKIADLVAALDSAERRYDRIRAMLGADIVPDPVRLGATLPVAPTVRARLASAPNPYEAGPSRPTHWPLDEAGYVTRGQALGGNPTDTRVEAHPGVDVAVPIGVPVRASGGGTVLQAGEDPEYGTFVLLEHPDGYQTKYGHLSRRTVTAGQLIDAGMVIGLSGNTGRSSAPHLHFEIRRGNEPIDPRTMLKESR
ncbi:MAG TPA: M23 family metallopeptidase [Gemmatimonadales bacterium]|nr:M23 family metallopeptidase [Gemmatimonadales bacterium]